MEVASLDGSISGKYRADEFRRHGVFCNEWVPFMALTSLRLYTAAGHIVNPNTQYRALCAVGAQVKDVVHWTWTHTRNLKVTALTPTVTAGVRHQLGQLMRLLVLNYPHLLHPENHQWSVRYQVANSDHDQVNRVLTANRQLSDPNATTDLDAVGTTIRHHGELEEALQDLVGDTKITYLHPHPHLARMVCLWAGPRRWKVSRKHFKSHIMRKTRQKGTRRRNNAYRKWALTSEDIAQGLQTMHWKQIRRIVGLTPWGEQLLFRVKHHALSVYDPVAAGLCCPHEDCTRAGTVTLHHVFWSCPAAGSLRAVLVDRWVAAGVVLPNLERAIFSLSLKEMPAGVATVTGRIIADCFDDTIGGLGDVVERIVGQCWSLGAAMYLHAVWRWRVAFFDSHNDTSKAHHVARYATRLRTGNAGIVYDYTQGHTDKLMTRLGRVICEVLGSNSTENPGRQVAPTNTTVLFYAGRVAKATKSGYSGAMIVQANRVTGRYRVLHLNGTLYEGTMEGVYRSTHLGLMKGLRTCRKYGWGPVHVVGDNAVITKQHSCRNPPKAAHIKHAYWMARRTADAVGVLSWWLHPRERNAAAHAAISVVKATKLGMNWNIVETPQQEGKWATVLARVDTDIHHWVAEVATSTQGDDVDGTV